MIRVRLESIGMPMMELHETPGYRKYIAVEPFKVNLDIEVDDEGNAAEKVKQILSKLSEIPDCYVEPIVL